MRAAIVRMSSVSKHFGSQRVLAGLDWRIAPGQVVGLLGRNGMGKTSLIRCVFNLAPPQVRGGSISYRGTELTTTVRHRIPRLGLGLVPQGRMVFGSLAVEENLTTTARGAAEGRWNLSTVYDFFPRLAERRTNLGSDLSGGEQQMLAIGRALMTNPSLLVMDEASEGLAPAVIAEIRDRLRGLKEHGLSVFFAEQNVGLAKTLADRIYILGEGGRIVWTGSAAEFDPAGAGARRHLGV